VSRKFYTILVVPHATAKFRRLRVSHNFAVGIGVALGILLLSGALLPHFVIRSTYLGWLSTRLAKQNAELKKANEEIDATLAGLRVRLNDFENRATQLASMIGVNSLPMSRQEAAGGGLDFGSLSPPDSARLVQDELKVLEQRSGQLADTLQVLDLAFAKQALLLSSTPSIIPVRGLYGNGFGWRRDPFTGARDFHQGLDIVAPPGSRVVAPADGVVTMAGRSGGFGNSVFISHGYGVITRYGHLLELQVKRGQKVRRGEPIATVGSTGRSTGPHLHYEVLVHQRNVDPLRYILDESRGF
jgi:murein DD-endopeptidase MepM/ murein hydrolase activator NlpD